MRSAAEERQASFSVLPDAISSAVALNQFCEQLLVALGHFREAQTDADTFFDVNDHPAEPQPMARRKPHSEADGLADGRISDSVNVTAAQANVAHARFVLARRALPL